MTVNQLPLTQGAASDIAEASTCVCRNI